jgi:transposase
MIVRYVRLLTASQRHPLAEIMQHAALPRARVRAHGIVRSAQGRKIKEIAKRYQVDSDTVATWIKQGEQHGVLSLYAKPRRGRPRKLTPEEQDLARPSIQEAPRCLQQGSERRHQKTAQCLSISSLQRLAKKARLRWKRVRKSFKSRRDPEEGTTCQRELAV